MEMGWEVGAGAGVRVEIGWGDEDGRLIRKQVGKLRDGTKGREDALLRRGRGDPEGVYNSATGIIPYDWEVSSILR